MQTMAQEIKAREALGLLKGWFNNKMTVVIFRIQHAAVSRKKRKVDVREQIIFLNDIQHHFSRRGIDQKAYYNAAKWLKAFFRIYPERITPERAKKAWAMLKPVYAGFGLRFPFNDDGVRKGDPFETGISAAKLSKSGMGGRRCIRKERMNERGL